MKVLILSVPRSGTKLLQSYIYSYLDSIGPTLTVKNNFTSLEDFLSPHSLTKNHKAYINTHNTIEFDDTTEVNDTYEIQRRMNDIIIPTTNNLVIKFLTLTAISDKLLDCFDKIIVLKRTNSFDLALSVAISANLSYNIKNISNADAHRDYIEHIISHPLSIDFDTFKKIYKENEDFINNKFKHYYENYDYTEITYDELLSIQTADDFCIKLNFPSIKFDLPNNILTEFGELKPLMIDNLQELYSHFKLS